MLAKLHLTVIPYVNKSWYNFIRRVVHLYKDNVTDVINELYKRTNYLLADFSFTESSTISHLLNSYCMNLYSSQLWCFNKRNV